MRWFARRRSLPWATLGGHYPRQRKRGASVRGQDGCKIRFPILASVARRAERNGWGSVSLTDMHEPSGIALLRTTAGARRQGNRSRHSGRREGTSCRALRWLMIRLRLRSQTRKSRAARSQLSAATSARSRINLGPAPAPASRPLPRNGSRRPPTKLHCRIFPPRVVLSRA
jgi:hypothetical protein